MRKTDPRVIRTRRMLRDALIATILEKGYDATNIQDITDRAGLRRATFYLHYRDKEELLIEMMQEVVDDLMARTDVTPDFMLSAAAQESSDARTFLHVQGRADLYRAILSGRGAAQITRAVRDYMAAAIRAKCMAQQPQIELPLPIDVLANYLAAVKLHMIIWWLENDMPYPPQQMAAMCSQLTLSGTSGVFDRLTT